MTPTPKAWLARSGRHGERDLWALESGRTPGGYGDIPDLSSCESLDDVRALVSVALPEVARGAVSNYSAQLWALRGRMTVGDHVVLPRKATAQLAVGRIAGNYWYDGSQTDSYKRHVRDVQWIRTDIPRTSVKQDLLYSLGAFSTYCEVSRNEAAARIAELARTGADPGTRIAAAKPFAHPKSVSAEDDAAAAAADTSPIDLEEYAQGRIAANIQERFSGHGMAVLVEAVLTARGYTCWRSPEGADGGVDLLAGSGPLGLDAPRLVVQVKSEQNPVGDPVLNQLIGSTTKHGTGAQGLLVAWGGLTQPAARSARDNYFRLRVWTAVDLINQLTANYGALPEEIRSEVVLKQIWVPVEDES